jgi:hypothetical protein
MTSPLEKLIAKRLGTTPAGLRILAKLAAKAAGAKLRTGTGGVAYAALDRLGLVKDGQLTPSGAEMVRRARAMGY